MNQIIRIPYSDISMHFEDDTVCKGLYFHCLLEARKTSLGIIGKLRNNSISLERGQFLTTVIQLAKEIDFTPLEIVAALRTLSVDNNKRKSKFSLILEPHTGFFTKITVKDYDQIISINKKPPKGSL